MNSNTKQKVETKCILVHGYACGIQFWKFLPAKPNGGFNGYKKYLEYGNCALFYWSRIVTKFGFWESVNPIKIKQTYRLEQNWASSEEVAKNLDRFFCEKFSISKEVSKEESRAQNQFSDQLEEKSKNQSKNQLEIDPVNADKNRSDKNSHTKYDKKIIAHSTGCRLVLNWLKRSVSLEEFLKHQTLEIDLYNPEFEFRRCLRDDFAEGSGRKILTNSKSKKSTKNHAEGSTENQKVEGVKPDNCSADSESFLIKMIQSGRLKINLYHCPWDQTLWLSPMYNYYFPAGIFGSRSSFFNNKMILLWQWNLNFHVASINNPKIAKKTMNSLL